MKASEIRKGHVLLVEGQPCRVMDFQHRTPGNLRAFVQVRMRNLVTGNTFDSRYIATEYVDEARLNREMAPGARVVSHYWRFPGLSPERTQGNIYRYRIG